MYHIAHKHAELSAGTTEHSRLLPESPLRKFNTMGGGKSMQDLLADSVRMKRRRRNSAQTKVLVCRPVMEHIQQSLSTAPYPKGVHIGPSTCKAISHSEKQAGNSTTALHLLSCDQ